MPCKPHANRDLLFVKVTLRTYVGEHTHPDLEHTVLWHGTIAVHTVVAL